MSLRPYRQELEVNIDFITPFTQERGGILCLNNASGIVEYAPSPIGRKVIGLQLNDIEFVNLTWQPHPQRLRNIDVPCGIAGVAMEGEFETDWIYPIGNIDQGSPAYAGPSGMFTNSPAYGVRVGTFTSILRNAPHAVIWRGAGFSRLFTDPCTKQPVWENDPAQAVRLFTPGYIRVRLNQSDIMSSQGGNT
jgi:hypothetical protein